MSYLPCMTLPSLGSGGLVEDSLEFGVWMELCCPLTSVPCSLPACLAPACTCHAPYVCLAPACLPTVCLSCLAPLPLLMPPACKLLLLFVLPYVGIKCALWALWDI